MSRQVHVPHHRLVQVLADVVMEMQRVELTAGRDNRGRVLLGVEVATESRESVVERLVVASCRSSSKVLAGVGVAHTTSVLCIEVALELAAIATVLAAINTNILEVLQSRNELLAEGREVLVRSTDANETSGGNKLATSAVVVNVVAGSDGRGADKVASSSSVGVRVGSQVGVESGGGSDEVNHVVERLRNGVLGGTGNLEAGRAMGEPLILGAEKLLHGVNWSIELDPAVVCQYWFNHIFLCKRCITYSLVGCSTLVMPLAASHDLTAATFSSAGAVYLAISS